jgi:hypothetical protein
MVENRQIHQVIFMRSNAHKVMPSVSSQNQKNIEAAPDEIASIDKQVVAARSRISDLGFEIDSYKASAGLAMGGGVFLILLAALAGYDLLTGKSGIWLAVGVTRDTLIWIAYGFGVAGAALIALALARHYRRDHKRETELADLEQEYARLLDLKDSIIAEPKDTGLKK